MGIHEGHRDRMKQEFLQGGLAHVSEPRVLEPSSSTPAARGM